MGTNTGELDIYFTNHLGQVIQNRVIEDYLPLGFETNTWQQVSIPLSDLGISAYNNTLALNIESATAQTVYLDEIRFIGTTTSSSFTQSNRYTGHDYDPETELTYAGARYLNSNYGKWISMDPANLDLGARTWESQYGRPLELLLRDPQQLNTYSYGRNNPMIVYDPGGDILPLGLAIAFACIVNFATDVNYAYSPAESTDLTNVPSGTNPLVPGYDNMSPSQKLSLQLAFMAFGNKANVGSLVRNGDNLVPVFRGGSGNNLFSIKPNEIKIDADGFVADIRGISVNTDASSLGKFGGANQITSLPDTLKIIQRGDNPNHYEIVPNGNLTPKQFQAELEKIKTKKIEG